MSNYGFSGYFQHLQTAGCLLWTLSKFPAEGSADEDENCSPYVQWHLGKAGKYGTVYHIHNSHS